jgi:stage V sporulation protein S
MGTKGAEAQVVQVGKNAKVSVVAERIASRVLEQGFIEMETVGEGAVNQAVKAAAMARRQLEPEGYSLVIIPAIVEVPLGHGSQTVVHLTVVDWHGG